MSIISCVSAPAKNSSDILKKNGKNECFILLLNLRKIFQLSSPTTMWAVSSSYVVLVLWTHPSVLIFEGFYREGIMSSIKYLLHTYWNNHMVFSSSC
jgi:hypothetical protein